MVASRSLRITLAVIGFGLGTAGIAADSDEEPLLLKLRLAQQQLLLAQKQKTPPQPKVVPKTITAVPSGAMPEGAVARLGDSRLRHAAAASCVTFSPDSRRVITGGQDGAIRVWDVATGEATDTVQVPSGTASGARFTHNETRLAVNFSDTQVRFLNASTLKEETAFQLGFGNDFDVSPDGTMIVGIASTGLLTVTELGSGLPKLEIPIQSPANTHYAFRPDGKTLAVGERTGKVTLYKLAGGKPVLSFDHGSPLNGMVFSPDGKRLATGGNTLDEVIKVWDLTDAKNQKSVAEIKAASKPQAWLGADRLAAASGRDAAGVYDLSEMKWVGLAKGIAGAWAISPDGTKIAATGNGALRVRMWDLNTGKQLHADNDTFPDAALLAPTPDGKSVFVLAGDTGYIWPLGQREATPAGMLPAKAVVAATGGARLAVATPEAVLVYDEFDPAKPLPAKPSRKLIEFATEIRSVAVSPDGKKLAYSGTDPAGNARIAIADAVGGKTIRVLPTQTIGLAVAFSPDSSKLALVGRDGFLRLWATDQVVDGVEDTDLWRVRVQRGPRGAVAFSPDGKLIAASSASLLLVVDAANGNEAFTLERRNYEDGIFQQVAFSPDSRLLITGSAGLTGAVQVWEVATRSLVRRYTTGFGAVNRLSIFPNGSRAVSAGAEEVVTVWDLTFRKGKGAPKVEELAAAWADLDSLDAAKGYPAIRTLVSGGASGVRAVGMGLDETLDAQKKIAKWVKQLGDDDFTNREAATKALVAQGIRSLPAVQSAAARAESQEVRTRGRDILDTLMARGVIMPGHKLAGDMLRLVRAVHVLEEIGGAEAKALLKKIAEDGDRCGDLAKTVLKRLEQ